MPYRYLEDIALADAAFEAWGRSLEEMFVSASDAVINIMVRDLAAIRRREYRHFRIQDAQLDMLLFQLLQELVFYKDAEQLLLLVQTARIQKEENAWTAFVEVAGEPIDASRHELVVDVKAITLHRLKVEETPRGWSATVTVDV